MVARFYKDPSGESIAESEERIIGIAIQGVATPVGGSLRMHELKSSHDFIMMVQILLVNAERGLFLETVTQRGAVPTDQRVLMYNSDPGTLPHDKIVAYSPGLVDDKRLSTHYKAKDGGRPHTGHFRGIDDKYRRHMGVQLKDVPAKFQKEQPYVIELHKDVQSIVKEDAGKSAVSVARESMENYYDTSHGEHWGAQYDGHSLPEYDHGLYYHRFNEGPEFESWDIDPLVSAELALLSILCICCCGLWLLLGIFCGYSLTDCRRCLQRRLVTSQNMRRQRKRSLMIKDTESIIDVNDEEDLPI